MAQSMNEHTLNWQAVGEETIARTRDLLRHHGAPGASDRYGNDGNPKKARRT